MTCRDKRDEETKNSRHDFGRIEELYDEREVDQDAEHVRSADFAGVADPGDPAEDGDTAHFVLIMEDVQHLLHERLLAAVIRFAQIDSDDGNLRFHGVSPTYTWRREAEHGSAASALPDLVPVVMTHAGDVTPAPAREQQGAAAKPAGAIEIALPGGVRVTVRGRVDERALHAVLSALRSA